MFSIFGKKAAAKQSDRQSEPPADGEGRYVRPMQSGDVDDVLAIIEDHDEDDAEEAAETFAHSLEGIFVAVDNGDVVGVTGAAFDDETEMSCWLSWTYVSEGHRRQGVGRYLVDGLFHELRNRGVRKVFVSTGDYVEDGRDIYEDAKQFYTALGAQLEQKVDDYYEPGEANYTFGIELVDLSKVRDAPAAGYLTFDGLGDLDEAEDGAYLTWREFVDADANEDPGTRLQNLIQEAKSKGKRLLVAAFPADLREGAEEGLEAAGFERCGELRHYYQPGLHQVHWLLRFNR